MSARLAPSSRLLPLLFVAFLFLFVFLWPSPPWVINVIIIIMSGLGLTPQCASGIAAFYHSTARFVGWLAQLDAPDTWLGPDQKLDDPDTWEAANLAALGRTHR